MDSLPELLPEPSMESDSEIASKNQTRAPSPGDDGGSLLADGNLVSPSYLHGSGTPSPVGSEVADDARHSFRHLPVDKSELETLRLETIRKRFEGQGYSQSAMNSLIQSVAHQTGPRSPYRHAQYLFLQWSSRKDVDPNTFTVSELTTFLSDALLAGYSFSTVQIFRPAVRRSTDLKALLKHSKRIAALKQLLKPRVDISPTLRFLARIPSDTSAPLADLNKKAAFLLAMAAFLRPSDLECNSLHHCTMTSQGDIAIKVVAPKELRAGRRIIKVLAIPVKRPSNKLLVNSWNPSNPLKSTTISTWLRNLLRLSISHMPSVRSVASDLALARGAPLTDVITMDFAIRLEQVLADKEEMELIFMSKELSATALMLYKSYLAHSVKEVNKKVIKSLIK
ncbi:hypothetical protein BC943DRAFT_373959 [Umbelopsis sp. AD052]|nr:hypothetical protein BC943DRAFT_373959 [Umbelopsis sp. AD052]